MPLMSGVGIRLAFMMVLALLPLGLISMSQTKTLIRAGENAALNVLVGETVAASLDLVTLISDSQAMVRTLAVTVTPYVDDPVTCQRMMKAAAMLVPEASLVAYIPLSGQMVCADNAGRHDFTDSVIFDNLVATPEARMFISDKGPVTGLPILGLSHPVHSPNQEFIGIVTVSLPQAAIAPAPSPNSPVGAEYFVFDRRGTLLSSHAEDAGLYGLLPRGRSLTELANRGAESFIAPARNGSDRMFAAMPVEGDVFLLSSWPVSPESGSAVAGLHPYLLPILMWIAGLAMALLAAERLVARHLRKLSHAMESFVQGERHVPPPVLDSPPTEIARLASDYHALTSTIIREEANREALLRQRAELLREVHHRTGNSLQLIASILRMHLREEPEEATRNLLENIHDRVMGLSTVHFGLYRMSGLSNIQMDSLLAEVIGKIGAIHSRYGRKDSITADLNPVQLQTQQAVPLSLLVSEILSAFPAADIDDADETVHVTLEDDTGPGQDIETAVLTITGPAEAFDTLKGTGSGVPEIIASRLIRAFVAQLDGTLETTLSEDRRSVTATIRFRIQKSAAADPAAPSPL